jgi:hypothetical protein
MSVATEVTFDEAVTTGAETVKAARGILDRAREDSDRWPEAGRGEIAETAWWLADSLRAWENLTHGRILPGTGRKPGAGPLREALDKAAALVRSNSGELVRVIGKHCGDEAAAKVRGEGGEQS